jgi:uncharacterized repeat protein (TIGR01451 family)
MKHSNLKTLLLAVAMIGLIGSASAKILEPGYAVHTFGVSPNNDSDGNYTMRVYRINNHEYESSRPTADFSKTDIHSDWTINQIGNVYGVTIDRGRNIYVTASANYSNGYIQSGDSSSAVVPVKYGIIGGGADDLNASGTIYKIDASTGDASIFAQLPQTSMSFTHQVCGKPTLKKDRTTGPGLGNIVYDKFHNQFFVSNFSDGRIYRIDANGVVKDHFDTELGGIGSVGSAYGLAISPDGKKLLFGTIEIQNDPYHPKLFAVEIYGNGTLAKNKVNQDATLALNIKYTQNIGGSDLDNGWAAYSDLDFTPDGELLVGVRVGCEQNFATSYNHGGAVYLLTKKNGKYNEPAKGTIPNDTMVTTYEGNPNSSDSRDERTGKDDSGQYRFDAGNIPLRLKGEQATLEYGPDDGYGGVAHWQDGNKTDLFATYSDISSANGVHGFAQFSREFSAENGSVEKIIGYKSVESSTADRGNTNVKYDYKGIGGDVEVLNEIDMCIGSYVWEDKVKNGVQNSGEPGIDDATVNLFDSSGKKIKTMSTQNGGIYEFCGLPEGKYKVCVTAPDAKGIKYTPTINQVTSETDNETDTNMGNDGCSAYFGLWANTEPVESGDAKGDKQDDNADKLGNMTVDFGFIKNVFDLALVKTIENKKDKYSLGETVTFKITVTNQGSVEAKNVNVIDNIPEGLELNDDKWSANGNKATLNSPIASIKPKMSEYVTIKFKIKDDFQGTSIVNVAEISHAENNLDLADADSTPSNKQCDNNNHDLGNDNNVSDTNGCDDLDPAMITIEQKFDLALIKQREAGTTGKRHIGDIVDFRITVINQGTIDAHNVQVRDYIPDGFELASDKWKMDGDDAVLKRPISEVKKENNASVIIRLKITKDFSKAKKPVYNWAEIDSDDNTDRDSKPGNGMCKNDNDINIHKNDDHLKDENGCDDVDVTPAILPVAVKATESEEFCYCENAASDSVDSTSTFVLILLLLGTLMMAIHFLPREDAA